MKIEVLKSLGTGKEAEQEGTEEVTQIQEKVEEDDEKEGAEALRGSDVRRESVVLKQWKRRTRRNSQSCIELPCDAIGACDLLDAPRRRASEAKALGQNTEYGVRRAS